MQYDRLGFPIPKEFETIVGPSDPVPAGRRRRPGFDVDEAAPVPGRFRRFFLLAVLLFGVVPALLLPRVLPPIRRQIIQGAIRRAMIDEGHADVAAAARRVGWAVAWGDDAPGLQEQLLCWRSTLRLQGGDVSGAVADATQAAVIAPTSPRPLQTRAIAHVVGGEADAALADAEAVVALHGDGNPEALNHRAYIRALVGRDLPAALADVERALTADAESPEFLDTRGFLLHLLGRQHEAIDDLNRAIVGTQQTRRRLVADVGDGDPVFVAWRLRSVEHALAVMHQHRALACRAAGLAAQAEQDFEVARRKGFAPDRGVL